MTASENERKSLEPMPLQLPTENVITSQPTWKGRLIVLYKRIVKAAIDPYLRNVFDKEHEHLQLINRRLALCDQRLDKIETDVQLLLHHQHLLENDRQREMIQRIDAAARQLHRRLEKVEQAVLQRHQKAAD